MKNIKKQKHIKQITYIIIILMLCNFILPNYSYADDSEGGGIYFDPFAKFVTFLCDSVMQYLQTSFTSIESISNDDGTYNFQYSPAIIFSGTVPAFDINFIDPNEETKESNTYGEYVLKHIAAYNYNSKEETEYETEYKNATSHEGYHYLKGTVPQQLSSTTYKVYYWIEGEELHVACQFDHGWKLIGARYTYYAMSISLSDIQDTTVSATYESTAGILQSTIATWYNALRRIALVGLLSVLLYVGIRILLSSVEGKENSKYKKMLVDWLIALCLLFTLHYMMNLIIIVTQKISSIFTIGETDELLNTLRLKIEQGTSWGNVTAEVIMYVVLTIYTGIFTFQYLKRVLYMAFFTLIAPLITLTYPLDKMNDGQAQAFNMWLREYIFNALLQVVHLIIYYILVGSALDLVELYPIYAVIAIGFMTQGEKIIRKMFGFENATTIGSIGAAAAGGLIANAMNKLKKMPKPSQNGEKDGRGENSNGKGVRTATVDPLSALQGKGSSLRSDQSLQSEGSPTGDSQTRITPKGSSPTEGTQTGASPKSGLSAGGSPKKGLPKSTEAVGSTTKPKRNIGNGVKSLAGRYLMSGAKNLAKGFVGGTGALIGFSAGIAQGDISSAIGGAFAGGKAGSGLIDWGASKTSGMGRTFNEARDTFNEGAYGKEVAQNMKFDKKFRKSETYKALQSNPNFSDGNIQAMLDVGITQKKAMEKILNNSNGGNDIGNAIVNYTLAKNCPDNIFYNSDDSKLQMWLETQNEELGKIDVKTMRENMKKFK